MGRTPSGHQDPATAAINGTNHQPSTAANGSEGSAANGTEEGCTQLCNNNNPVGSSILQEASYSVTYGERGAGVVLIASEPITGSTTDWVSAAATCSIGLRQQVDHIALKFGKCSWCTGSWCPTKNHDEKQSRGGGNSGMM